MRRRPRSPTHATYTMTALSPIPVFDAADTAALLDYPALLATLRQAVADYAAGEIVSPERLVVPLQAGGVMLSMPSSARDLATHKLVNVCPGNGARGLPTILGSPPTTRPPARCASRSTARRAPHGGHHRARHPGAAGRRAARHPADRHRETGGQSRGSARRDLSRSAPSRARHKRRQHSGILCRAPRAGASPRAARRRRDPRCDRRGRHADDEPHARLSRSRARRPTRGRRRRVTADAAEIDANTVRASRLVVDDPAGARHEAGDLIVAQVDWQHVASLADVLGGAFDRDGPLLFKSVGCAAWDLAACRTARDALAAHRAG